MVVVDENCMGRLVAIGLWSSTAGGASVQLKRNLAGHRLSVHYGAAGLAGLVGGNNLQRLGLFLKSFTFIWIMC